MSTREATLTLVVIPLAHTEKLIEFRFLDILKRAAWRMCGPIFFLDEVRKARNVNPAILHKRAVSSPSIQRKVLLLPSKRLS